MARERVDPTGHEHVFRALRVLDQVREAGPGLPHRQRPHQLSRCGHGSARRGEDREQGERAGGVGGGPELPPGAKEQLEKVLDDGGADGVLHLDGVREQKRYRLKHAKASENKTYSQLKGVH